MFIANPLNESHYAFPILESVHLLGIFCGVGTTALVNLSLLRGGMSSANLWRETKVWTLGGLSLAIFSGLLLFSIDPELYFNKTVFRLKMLALLLALGFYYTVIRQSAGRDAKAPLAAGISLLLWALVPLGGLLLGYE
jgi:hypothetical protein